MKNIARLNGLDSKPTPIAEEQTPSDTDYLWYDGERFFEDIAEESLYDLEMAMKEFVSRG